MLARRHDPRFVDRAPGQVYAQLLDEGTYLCSERTMDRVLAEAGEGRDRRDQCRHPRYAAPELLATGSNQLWSWDITKLRGPSTWTWYYLYVLLDVFSRYVVGWLLAYRESAHLAQQLIAATVAREGIVPGQLTVHADRGAAMTSKPVAFLLADLGITKTHSRPHVSNDNPYSEAQCKTLKYHPIFSPGTTPNTGTAASAGTRPTPSITGSRPRNGTSAPPCSPPRTPPDRTGSSGRSPSPPRCPRPCGSIPRSSSAPPRTIAQ